MEEVSRGQAEEDVAEGVVGKDGDRCRRLHRWWRRREGGGGFLARIASPSLTAGFTPPRSAASAFFCERSVVPRSGMSFLLVHFNVGFWKFQKKVSSATKN